MLKTEIIEALEERLVQTHMDHLLVVEEFRWISIRDTADMLGDVR